MPRCLATRKDGSPCKGRALPSSDVCRFHSAQHLAEAPRLRVLGGRAKSRANRAGKLVPATLRPVLDRLLAALARVDEGQMPARQAAALAALASAICRVYELGEAEQRLRELERSAR